MSASRPRGRRALGAAVVVGLLGAVGVRAPQVAGDADGAGTVRVRDAVGLGKALLSAKPGTRILVEPGEYPGGVGYVGLSGTEGKPIVLAGADPARPPVFVGGATGIHLIDASHVELRDLAFRGATGNGVNLDDGGTPETPAHHVLLSRLRVTDVGPTGNHDGIKLSGIVDFRVEECVLERWGTGGSGVDMVGCRRGVLEGNTLRHTEEQNASGIQMKGGSESIVVRKNRFERAGGRAVNLGGSTGLAYFRPPLDASSGGEHFEARDILVEGNTFVGSAAAVAFVGATDSVVRFNTIHRPGRWALRILQETRAPGFVPCRKGQFTDNIVVFEAEGWGGAVNVGPGTEPESFTFARNVWYAADRPGSSRPQLPTAERDGVHGKDPMFVDAPKGDFALRRGSPAAKAGATALPK